MKMGRWVLVVGLLLSACAGSGQALPPTEAVVATPTATPSPALPELVPERAVTPASEVAPLVAEQLGVPTAELTLVEAEAVEWPDASLGCPQPGMRYAQVISPGWRLVFIDGEGETVVVHTGREPREFVVCASAVTERATSTTAGDQVRDLLAEQLRVSPETLTLISANTVEWSDASLGCPQPGMMYAQVITPGHQYVFADQSGRRYDVRTGRNPKHFVLCEGGISGAARATPPASLIPAAQAAREWLAKEQGIPETRLTVVLVEARDWPDSCLGCPPPGTFCLTVIVPGYRVVLQDGEVRYAVRTDREGRSIAMCQP